ncbi:MAG: DUF3782 domain-containing protein [Pseudomonadota bacterium]|nr:DUF3782 domain-containing protein [Pseudomonadota bacterium]
MTQFTIDSEQLEQFIVQKLPKLMQQNPEFQEAILQLAQQSFAERQEVNDRFYQLLGELKRDREERALEWKEYLQEQNHKWEEQNHKWEEQNRKWEEQNRKWDEQNRKWEDAKLEFAKTHEAIMAVAKKYERSISALGARWGLKSERSFRNALAGILEDSFEIQVVNVVEYDDEGIVFGRPDQIELDVIIKNGLLIICELKSSMSRSDVYTFEKKVRFYEQRHQRQANRLLIISPMVEDRARKVAQKLGIEVFDDSLDIENL